MTPEKALERVKAEIVTLTKRIESCKPPLWSAFAVWMWKNELGFYRAVERALTPSKPTVSRAWVDKTVKEIEDFLDVTVPGYDHLGLTAPLSNILDKRLREKGIEVEEKRQCR